MNPSPATLEKPKEKQPVLVISSFVMSGAVGIRATGFVLERLGHPLWAAPTLILPWHPGHGPATRQLVDQANFEKCLKDLTEHPDFANLGGIITGFLGAPEQIPPVTSLIDRLKEANPDALYLCDPVLGDKNGLYIAEQTAQMLKEHLVPRADILTPNRFEFDWLVDKTSDTNEALIEEAKKLACPLTLITSAHALMRNAIANLLVFNKNAEEGAKNLLCEHHSIPNPPNGTGDMVSALFLAHKLAGLSDEEILRRTSSAVFEIVARSTRAGYRDLELARFADRFVHPLAMVNMRTIGTGLKVRKPIRKNQSSEAASE